ncbi:(deoxy)nucleoside triphosphate pyrophosphohydrolase [Caldalkalibacillus mannanilyticus]|uniref:(deoxy)nucleoside triphosphate pyrophosphohydrolase n=1 Tax=Caldalkalibacillus mannanilyticus TaxID=1418 RepID=UPI00046A2E5B|nr:(deoxy)nucleoside triphosphate pyrophosphohydrolase [Caldalkalibacillus mannanilyticus]
MKKVIVVGAVIENPRGEILCALRSPDMSMPDYWEFPGGKVEEGESYEVALKREIREELGCEIDVLEKIIDVEHVYEKVLVHLHTYWASISGGEPKAREHAELRWVAKESLAALRWAPADLPTLEIVQNSFTR